MKRPSTSAAADEAMLAALKTGKTAQFLALWQDAGRPLQATSSRRNDTVTHSWLGLVVAHACAGAVVPLIRAGAHPHETAYACNSNIGVPRPTMNLTALGVLVLHRMGDNRYSWSRYQREAATLRHLIRAGADPDRSIWSEEGSPGSFREVWLDDTNRGLIDAWLESEGDAWIRQPFSRNSPLDPAPLPYEDAVRKAATRQNGFLLHSLLSWIKEKAPEHFERALETATRCAARDPRKRLIQFLTESGADWSRVRAPFSVSTWEPKRFSQENAPPTHVHALTASLMKEAEFLRQRLKNKGEAYPAVKQYDGHEKTRVDEWGEGVLHLMKMSDFIPRSEQPLFLGTLLCLPAHSHGTLRKTLIEEWQRKQPDSPFTPEEWALSLHFFAAQGREPHGLLDARRLGLNANTRLPASPTVLFSQWLFTQRSSLFADSIATTLNELGVDPNALTPDGTPWFHGVLDEPTWLDWALQAGANLEAVDGKGYTALLRTARHGKTEALRTLLKQGADPNAVAEDLTLLEHAIASGDVSTLCRVLEAHPLPENGHGDLLNLALRLPAHRFSLTGRSKILEILDAARIDWTQPDSEGVLPLHAWVTHAHDVPLPSNQTGWAQAVFLPNEHGDWPVEAALRWLTEGTFRTPPQDTEWRRFHTWWTNTQPLLRATGRVRAERWSDPPLEEAFHNIQKAWNMSDGDRFERWREAAFWHRVEASLKEPRPARKNRL